MMQGEERTVRGNVSRRTDTNNLLDRLDSYQLEQPEVELSPPLGDQLSLFASTFSRLVNLNERRLKKNKLLV